MRHFGSVLHPRRRSIEQPNCFHPLKYHYVDNKDEVPAPKKRGRPPKKVAAESEEAEAEQPKKKPRGRVSQTRKASEDDEDTGSKGDDVDAGVDAGADADADAGADADADAGADVDMSADQTTDHTAPHAETTEEAVSPAADSEKAIEQQSTDHSSVEQQQQQQGEQQQQAGASSGGDTEAVHSSSDLNTTGHAKSSERKEKPPKPCFAYFSSTAGCSRGEECKYSHVLPPGHEEQRTRNGPCNDYKNGRCSKGISCRFSHMEPHGADLNQQSDPRVGSRDDRRMDAPRRKPCFDYQEGHCTRGDVCPYEHTMDKVPCGDFTRNGYCKRGDRCKFAHNADGNTGRYQDDYRGNDRRDGYRNDYRGNDRRDDYRGNDRRDERGGDRRDDYRGTDRRDERLNDYGDDRRDERLNDYGDDRRDERVNDYGDDRRDERVNDYGDDRHDNRENNGANSAPGSRNGYNYGREGSNHHPPASASAPGRITTVCYAFQKGECRRGDSCRFDHRAPYPDEQKPKGICYDYQRSSCVRGDDCPFEHRLQDRERTSRAEVQSGTQIFVSNLAYSVTEKDLRCFFTAFGGVSEVRILTDRDTGRSKAMGFVTFTDAESAKTALEQSGRNFEGRDLRIELSKRATGR